MRRVSPELRLRLRLPVRGWGEVVGASTIVEVFPLDEPDVVGDACDPAAGVGRHPVNHQVRIAAKGPCSSGSARVRMAALPAASLMDPPLSASATEES